MEVLTLFAGIAKTLQVAINEVFIGIIKKSKKCKLIIGRYLELSKGW